MTVSNEGREGPHGERGRGSRFREEDGSGARARR